MKGPSVYCITLGVGALVLGCGDAFVAQQQGLGRLSPRLLPFDVNNSFQVQKPGRTIYNANQRTTLSAGRSVSWPRPTLPKKIPSLDKETQTSIASGTAFVILDIFFRRVFTRFDIAFPSSLGGCAVLLATLLALPNKAGSSLFDKLRPGALLLAKWLPVFFVPSLVTLPLANGMGSAAELLKVGFVIVGGFYLSLVSTAGSVVGVSKLLKRATSTTRQGETQVNEAIEATKQVVDNVSNAKALPAKPFSDDLFNSLVSLAVGSGFATAVAAAISGSTPTPLSAFCLLCTTLASFVGGTRLPKSFTKLVHPLVTCTCTTWMVSFLLGAATKRSFFDVLRSYRTGASKSFFPQTTGAGDLLLFLLGPAVISLAISMFERRKLMRDNMVQVGTAVSVATFGGVFGTALAVRLLDIADPSLRLSLLSRNITSPLAMAISSILGADVSLAVSFVVVTGLIGANFGASLLDGLGIRDPVARGLGIGAAAHGLGTAAFANEKDAFPFAAIAMALTASAATVTVCIPVLKKMILQLALG